MVRFVVANGIVYINPVHVLAVYQAADKAYARIELPDEMAYEVKMSAAEVVSDLRGAR